MRLLLHLALLAVLLPACSYGGTQPVVAAFPEVKEETRKPIEAWKGRRVFKRDLIKRYGHARFLNLFAAQIHRESLWKHDAESWVGAFGCGQFMPATQGDAKYWARDLGSVDWANCRQSARASIRYMKAIYRRIKGDPCYSYREAVKDYNRGMGHGDKERRLGYCVRNKAACKETEDYHKAIFDRLQTKFHKMKYGEVLACR